jgi:hypothetical protein
MALSLSIRKKLPLTSPTSGGRSVSVDWKHLCSLCEMFNAASLGPLTTIGSYWRLPGYVHRVVDCMLIESSEKHCLLFQCRRWGSCSSNVLDPKEKGPSWESSTCSVKKFVHFTTPEGLWSCSQESKTGCYPDLDESSSKPPILLRSILILSSHLLIN